MIISEVITLAKYSELAGVKIKDSNEAIVAFLNLGMTELHKRFPIRVEEHLVTLVEGQSLYTMPANFSKCLQVFGEMFDGINTEVIEIPVNDSDNDLSIHFTNWKTVQVPDTITGTSLSIIYVAKPERVTEAQALDGSTELELPDSLLDCLLSFIGYKAYLSVKSDARSESGAHWQRFEMSCTKAEELGMAFPAEHMSMGGRLSNRGFV